MTQLSGASRYSSLFIALHWFMFVLLVAVFVTMEMRGQFPRGSDARELMKALHFMLGVSVLLLVVIRLALRLSSTTPPIVPAPKPWENALAKLVHISLYAFMLFMPIAGWLILSAEGKTVPFFGLQLPPLIDANAQFAEQIEDLHKQVGTFGYYLIALHVVAALFHHYVKRDNTLQRMAPRARQ